MLVLLLYGLSMFSEGATDSMYLSPRLNLKQDVSGFKRTPQPLPEWFDQFDPWPKY
jgi:hypothetical protein